MLPEQERLARWAKAFEFKLEHGLDSDSDDDCGGDVRKRRVEEDQFIPGQYDHPAPSGKTDGELAITDKGKAREYPITPRLANSHAQQNFEADHEDVINWPEDESDSGGPPSSVVDTPFFSDDEAAHPCEFRFGDIPRVDENFGREYLEPYTEPIAELPPIPEDQVFKKFMHESAIKIREQFRARTVHLYEKKKAQMAAKAARRETLRAAGSTVTRAQKPATIWTSTTDVIGLVYLISSQNFADPLHRGECNIGMYIAPEYRSLEHASDAINAVVADAFRDHDCHRLQAILVDHQDIIDFLSLYTRA